MEKSKSESLIIRAFGSKEGPRRTCDVVNVGVKAKDGGMLKLSFVVVPHICNPISIQPTATSKLLYSHIATLDLADPGDTRGGLMHL